MSRPSVLVPTVVAVILAAILLTGPAYIGWLTLTGSGGSPLLRAAGFRLARASLAGRDRHIRAGADDASGQRCRGDALSSGSRVPGGPIGFIAASEAVGEAQWTVVKSPVEEQQAQQAEDTMCPHRPAEVERRAA